MPNLSSCDFCKNQNAYNKLTDKVNYQIRDRFSLCDNCLEKFRNNQLPQCSCSRWLKKDQTNCVCGLIREFSSTDNGELNSDRIVTENPIVSEESVRTFRTKERSMVQSSSSGSGSGNVQLGLGGSSVSDLESFSRGFVINAPSRQEFDAISRSMNERERQETIESELTQQRIRDAVREVEQKHQSYQEQPPKK